jgi:hypothetical protein
MESFLEPCNMEHIPNSEASVYCTWGDEIGHIMRSVNVTIPLVACTLVLCTGCAGQVGKTIVFGDTVEVFANENGRVVGNAVLGTECQEVDALKQWLASEKRRWQFSVKTYSPKLLILCESGSIKFVGKHVVVSIRNEAATYEKQYTCESDAELKDIELRICALVKERE